MMQFDRNLITKRIPYELFTCEQVNEALIKREKVHPSNIIAVEITKTDDNCIVTWYYSMDNSITAYDISCCYDIGTCTEKKAALMHDLRVFNFTFVFSLWDLKQTIDNPTLDHIIIKKNHAQIKN